MSVPRDRGRFSEGGNLVVNSVERVYYPDDGRDQTNRLPVLPMSVVYAPPQKSFTDSQLFEEEGTHHEEQPVKIYYYFPLFLILASIADIVLMGVAIWLNHGFEPFSVNPFYGPSVDVLIEMGAKDVQKIQQDYEVWRFVVPIFLHAGLIHLAFNLLFQLQCFMIERQCGFFRIGIVYMLAGIGGNILSSIFAPDIISVGASGSLFGLIGTMLVMILINWRYTWRPLFNLSFLIILLVLALGLGLLPMVDNWTHIGGLVIGFLTSMVVVPSIGRPYSCCRAMFSLVCIGLVVALYGVGLWAIFGDKLHLRDWCGDVCDKIDCYDFGQKWWNCTAYES